MSYSIGKVGQRKDRFRDFHDLQKLLSKSGQAQSLKQIKDSNIDGISRADLNKFGVFGAVWNKEKEQAGANGASTAGVGTQPAAVDNGGTNNVDDAVNNDNNNTELNANATGHTANSQAPATPNALTATQGGDNADNPDGATDGEADNTPVQQDSPQKILDDLFKKGLEEMRQAENKEDVPSADEGDKDVATGEGTLSTGEAEGPDGADDVNGPTNVEGPPTENDEVQGPNDANPNDPANKNENPDQADPANDNPNNINKQEEQNQQKLQDQREGPFDPKRFRKLDEEAA